MADSRGEAESSGFSASPMSQKMADYLDSMKDVAADMMRFMESVV